MWPSNEPVNQSCDVEAECVTISVCCCQGPAGEIGPPGQQGNPGVQVLNQKTTTVLSLLRVNSLITHPINVFKTYRHASNMHHHLQAVA